MKELEQLGFEKTRTWIGLEVAINGKQVALPSAYLEFCCWMARSNLELGFKFTPTGDSSEWEGQVVEFMQYDSKSVNAAIVENPLNSGQLLLPISTDAGGNYLYLDLTASPMSVVDVSYESGRVSLVASSFNEFLAKLYLMDA